MAHYLYHGKIQHENFPIYMNMKASDGRVADAFGGPRVNRVGCRRGGASDPLGEERVGSQRERLSGVMDLMKEKREPREICCDGSSIVGSRSEMLRCSSMSEMI